MRDAATNSIARVNWAMLRTDPIRPRMSFRLGIGYVALALAVQGAGVYTVYTLRLPWTPVKVIRTAPRAYRHHRQQPLRLASRLRPRRQDRSCLHRRAPAP